DPPGRGPCSAATGRTAERSTETRPRCAPAQHSRETKIRRSPSMTWATFYLGCFLVGATLSVIAFAFGGLHLMHFHFPHLLHGHVPQPDVPRSIAGSDHSSMPVFNLGPLTVFLAWFGATGYLLSEHSPLAALLILLFAGGAGTAGAAVVFWFVVKLLLA